MRKWRREGGQPQTFSCAKHNERLTYSRFIRLIGCMRIRYASLLLSLVLFATAASAQAPQPTATFALTRAAGAITIDGDLSDPGWKDAVRADKWFETNATD